MQTIQNNSHPSGLTKAGNDGRAKREVGDEVAIHNVHVEPIGAHLEHLGGIAIDVGQITGEQRRCNDGRGGVGHGSVIVLVEVASY